MPDSAGRQIDTREELIAALCEAAELEHNLLVQYLFAAMSVRPTPVAAVAGALPGYAEWRAHEVVRGIQSQLYVICREEMAHLGTVNNLLTSIGAHPYFRRAPMEDVRSRLMIRPARRGARRTRIKFSLEPFSIATIARFRDFETPERPRKQKAPPSRRPPGPPKPSQPTEFRAAPDSLDYGTVGGLYQLIAEGFKTLDERLGSQLFIGAASLQDRWGWDAGLRLMGVSDLRSALAAIDFIVTEGEGSPFHKRAAGPDRSHLARLNRMDRTLTKMQGAIQLDRHVWPVVSNPATTAVRARSQNVSMLNPGTPPKVAAEFQCAELFNGVYTCALHMLSQFYDPATESAAQRAALGHANKQVMSAILRPIGEVVMSLPATGYAAGHAGPPFEIYGHLDLPSRTVDRWTLLLERVENLARVANQIADQEPTTCGRLHFVSANLRFLMTSLDKTRRMA